MISEADLNLRRQVTKFQQAWNEDEILKATIFKKKKKQTALLRVISQELKPSDPESHTNQTLDLFLVVPGSNSQLHLNSQLRINNRNS